MRVLALNCGSSTVKYQLFDISSEERLLQRGQVEQIGSRGSVANHREAIAGVLGDIAGQGEVEAVGHRVVHGGEHYTDSVLIDSEVEQRIADCASLAPLHNPHNLAGYRATREALPDCPQVAVFDTAFHQTMPREAYLYGLPLEYHTKHRIRRYGFHGTSHRYSCLRFAELHGASPQDFRLIVCHLGSGSSLCAVDRGRSVDVSLGFTPLEGLVMGTRSGDLDPGLVIHLLKNHGLTPAELNELLTRRSGLLGLSGRTNDMRLLVESSSNGDERARIAIEVFCYRVRRYIGSFFGILNGADALIFTGGIGENSPEVRRRCCESLDALGIRLDENRNLEATGTEMQISVDGARPAVWVIPANEELLIARETVRCIDGRRGTRPPSQRKVISSQRM